VTLKDVLLTDRTNRLKTPRIVIEMIREVKNAQLPLAFPMKGHEKYIDLKFKEENNRIRGKV